MKKVQPSEKYSNYDMDNNGIFFPIIIDQVIIRVLSLQGRVFRNLARDKKEKISRATTTIIETKDDDKFKMIITASVPSKA